MKATLESQELKAFYHWSRAWTSAQLLDVLILSQTKEGAVGWMFYVPASQIHILKSNPQCDGIRNWGLWEVIRS